MIESMYVNADHMSEPS